MENLGLYVHIPFCKSKCSYCDFSSFAGKNEKMPSYMEALLHEIDLKTQNKSFNTVYIGGGTPSLLNEELLEKLTSKIKSLNLTEDVEYTMEMNPESVTRKKAQIALQNGVNRVSIGLQSTKDSILKEIGRAHDFVTFVKAYRTLREVGFKNINVDIMYGLPGQTIEDLTKTLNTVIELKPEHISAYSLILEEGTAMEKLVSKGLLKLPDEDTVVEMMKLVNDRLKFSRFKRYEVSNYSKEGFESKHNFKYWNFDDYVAVGASASGFENGVRYINVDDIDEYIDRVKRKVTVRKHRYTNSKEDSMEEFIFMGLRTINGVDLKKYRDKFNESVQERFQDIIEKYEIRNLIKIDQGKMVLTDKGIDVSNYIMSDFIIDKE